MTRRIFALAAGLALAVPGAAEAATATVSGDDGNAVPLSGAVTIRNMSPEVGALFAPEEKRYSMSITGPSGAAAASDVPCIGTGAAYSKNVNYQGNGTYTVTIRTSPDSGDYNCQQLGAPQKFTFTIGARTAITAPAPTLLTRKPGEFAAIAYAFPVDVNPGADRHEIRYAAGAAIGPDGAISGPSDSAFLNTSTGAANVTFSKPGLYTFVARATDFGGAGDISTAWSAPAEVRVLAPFDLSTTALADSRGPKYKIAGQVRETTARGKLRLLVAKGKKGGKFRRLATGKIRSGAKFTLKFKLRRTGTYRLRYVFKGSPTVAAGSVTERFRVSRRLIFR